MSNILVTGATGNVGKEVLRQLMSRPLHGTVLAGVHDRLGAREALTGIDVHFCQMDFLNEDSVRNAFHFCDVLFLIRPPEMSRVSTSYKQIIDIALDQAVKHIVFLSVQGADNNKRLPHHKIQELIVASGIPYTFLQPAYFMQNFTTTLRPDLVERQLIFLPAGNASFTLVDIRDIASAAVEILCDPAVHRGRSYVLTAGETMTFHQMAGELTEVLGRPIRYQSPNLIRFFLAQHARNLPTGYILAMIMLHYLPRFSKAPPTADCVKAITGKNPFSFRQFVADHRDLLTIY